MQPFSLPFNTPQYNFQHKTIQYPTQNNNKQHFHQVIQTLTPGKAVSSLSPVFTLLMRQTAIPELFPCFRTISRFKTDFKGNFMRVLLTSPSCGTSIGMGHSSNWSRGSLVGLVYLFEEDDGAFQYQIRTNFLQMLPEMNTFV